MPDSSAYGFVARPLRQAQPVPDLARIARQSRFAMKGRSGLSKCRQPGFVVLGRAGDIDNDEA